MIEMPSGRRISLPLPKLNAGKPYSTQIKPFSLILSCHVAAYAHPADADPKCGEPSPRNCACADAENEQRVKDGKKPTGFTSLVRRAVISDDAFARALQGESIPLIERAAEKLLV